MRVLGRRTSSCPITPLDALSFSIRGPQVWIRCASSDVAYVPREEWPDEEVTSVVCTQVHAFHAVLALE